MLNHPPSPAGEGGAPAAAGLHPPRHVPGQPTPPAGQQGPAFPEVPKPAVGRERRSAPHRQRPQRHRSCPLHLPVAVLRQRPQRHRSCLLHLVAVLPGHRVLRVPVDGRAGRGVCPVIGSRNALHRLHNHARRVEPRLHARSVEPRLGRPSQHHPARLWVTAQLLHGAVAAVNGVHAGGVSQPVHDPEGGGERQSLQRQPQQAQKYGKQLRRAQCPDLVQRVQRLARLFLHAWEARLPL